MPETYHSARKQIADYEVLLDGEEERLRLLAKLARGDNLRQIERRIAAIQRSRHRLLSTLKEIEATDAKRV